MTKSRRRTVRQTRAITGVRAASIAPERCAQELCRNWTGDGRVCMCALMGLEGANRPIVPSDD